jgi:hypothetical protein
VPNKNNALGERDGRQGLDDFQGFEADGDDLADEADDVLLVIAVGVAGDLALFVALDAVLVDDPVEGAAVRTED